MILNKLAELADAENLVGDPAFDMRPVSWVVMLDTSGKARSIDDFRQDLDAGKTGKNGKSLKPRWSGKVMSVPAQPGRTSGDLAFFLVDKPEYTLGHDPTGVRPAEKVAKRIALFRDDVAACADATDDPAATAVRMFLDNVIANGLPFEVPKELGASDLIAFDVDGTFVHDRPAVKAWWREKMSGDAKPVGGRLRCLVTGESMAEAGLVPLIKSVPGGTSSGVSLISFNDAAFQSYGQADNANGPLSEDAARRVAAALNRLVSRRPIDAVGKPLGAQRIDLSTDSATVYWSSEPAMAAVVGQLFNVGDIFDDETPKPARVAEALQSIYTGRPPDMSLPGSFYAMTLSGTQGRLIVRDWFEQSLADTLANLATYFRRVELVRLTPPAKGKAALPALPLRDMLNALAPPGKGGSVPPSLASRITRAALTDGKFPTGLLPRILLRERAEAGGEDWIDSYRRDARMALMKAILCAGKHDLTPELDEQQNDPAYLSGRVMAVLEKTQMRAMGEKVHHAPITDRFLRTASAQPELGLPPMLGLFVKYVDKLRGDDKTRRSAIFADRLVTRLICRLRAFPGKLDTTEQALFFLGRHQQHADFFKPKNPASKDPSDA